MLRGTLSKEFFTMPIPELFVEQEEIITVPPNDSLCPKTLFQSDKTLSIQPPVRKGLEQLLRAPAPKKTLAVRVINVFSEPRVYPHTELLPFMFPSAWVLALLFLAQRHGEEGALLTNGFGNVFVFPGVSIRAAWDKQDDAWEFDDSHYYQHFRRGDRTFSLCP